MSAYIVSMETISVIAKGFIDYGVDCEGIEFTSMQLMLVNERIKPIGQWLLEQNYKSVNCRYMEDTPTPEFEFKEVEHNAGTLLGCINCYEYQACETPDWDDNPVYRSLETLKAEMLRRMIEIQGWEIPWGI